MQLKGKEFVEHRSGLFVSRDGEIFVPKSGKINEHFTYGTDSNGYKQVGYKCKQYKVHRLVAECFLDNHDNLPTVDHINRVKDDNRVENLRFADYSMQSYNRRNFTKPNYPKNRADSKKVNQLTMDGQLVKEWQSIQECGRNGFNLSGVWRCCRGKLKHYKKFIWKYAD